MGKIFQQALLKWPVNAQHFFGHQKNKNKAIMKHSPEWLKLMKQVMPSGDEKMEQLEHSHTAGRNVCTTTLKIVFIYFWRGEGREKERERNVWLPLERPLLGTWPATQACALTGNRTSDPLVRRLGLNPLSHASQGCTTTLKVDLALLQKCPPLTLRLCLMAVPDRTCCPSCSP